GLRQRLAPAFAAAVAALKAEREADVEEFQQLHVPLGLGQHLVEQGEEFLAAVVLALGLGKQTRPFASPGRRGGGVVEQRAKRKTRRLHLVIGNAGGDRAALEAVDLLAQAQAQPGGIGMAQRVPDLRHGGEDRVGGFDQRVQAAECRQVRRRRVALDRRREGAALSARRRKNYGGI